jgi:hypothetical protein
MKNALAYFCAGFVVVSRRIGYRGEFFKGVLAPTENFKPT